MLSKKSPGGATFPYYYKGGELFGLHLGSYFDNEAGVMAMMKAEGAFIIAQNRKIGLWIDFYETKLTPRVMAAFIEFLNLIRPRVTKLAIVGCPFSAKWKLNRLLKKADDLSSLPVRYYVDPEAAKTWLVSERE
jgi:hypothetical protein